VKKYTNRFEKILLSARFEPSQAKK
jgi:hypothetical protein